MTMDCALLLLSRENVLSLSFSKAFDTALRTLTDARSYDFFFSARHVRKKCNLVKKCDDF